MSDINLDFTVSNNSIDFTVQPNDITLTPTDIQLTIAAGGLAIPSGPTYGVQYDNNGVFGASDNFKFYPSNATIAVTNILVGNNAAFTSNINDVHISGGTNGYVLQTDGTGNLSWTAQSGGGGGNGTPGGSNTQIQYNDSGAFGGNAGFTFNEVTGNVNIPGNLIIIGSIVGNVTANYANYAGEAFDVSGSNVSGQVSNALIAGTVYTNAQPNITSLGTLSSLSVSGNISSNSFSGALGNLNYGIENIAIIGAQTGTYNMNLIDNAIAYTNANATSNLALNFRGNSTISLNSLLSVGQSITSVYVLKNGSTAYSVTNALIDGSSQSVKWVNGLSPTVVPNTSTSYTFTLIKTSSTPTYDVLGSGTRYS